ncbi:MAG: YgeY family selenium metabolism-linked hydrolase [bacterium]|nr:YgeY family selenium metabolism-linked hydrolase [bacterium]
MHAAVMRRARGYRRRMVSFLRDLISIPSESRAEGKVIERIGGEMRDAGFDSVKVDGMGNLLGRMGGGKRIIAMDAHVDTVGVGHRASWRCDPYEGAIRGGRIYGRGAVDQKAGMASLVYGARLIRELGLWGDFTLYVVGSVQEEDCDGLCWQYIIREDGLRPECVVITEPTNLGVYRGHRGRMEIRVTAAGRAAHASAPERGRNAIYAMGRVVREIERLNRTLRCDRFLGRGTVAVTDIKCESPSLCAVPDLCSIHLDRRLTLGEDRRSALREVREAVSRSGVAAVAEVLTYDLPSYRGSVYRTERAFPAWLLPRTHPLLRAAVDTSRRLTGRAPTVGRWIFSTNGVATMGMFGIPTVGFGPGEERYAHSIAEHVRAEQLPTAAAWYALFPRNYVRVMEGGRMHVRTVG